MKKKKVILTKKQLNEYISRKKNKKIFMGILKEFKKNSKNLNDLKSIKNANQSILDLYEHRNLINNDVKNMLIEYKLIDSNNKIL